MDEASTTVEFNYRIQIVGLWVSLYNSFNFSVVFIIECWKMSIII